MSPRLIRSLFALCIFADGPPPSALGWLLSYMDYVVGWAHSLSTMVVPSYVGEAGRTACVPAIVLAVLVRLAVASFFSVLRAGLGLPVSFVVLLGFFVV